MAVSHTLTLCARLMRRAGSNVITKLPESLGYLSHLKLLDCGNNRIATLADISCLRTCRALFSLNLAGNPVCQVEGYKEAVQNMIVVPSDATHRR